jgi:type IV secretion system protein VirB5
MKIFLTLTAAVILAGSAPACATGIPVVDGAHIAETILSHAEDIAKFIEQIKALEKQIDQQKEHYDSITGSRNLGKVLFDPRYRQYLPEDWQGVYDSVRSGGYAGLSSDAAAIRNAAMRYDACQDITDARQKTVCEALAVKGAQDKAFAQKSFDMAKERVAQIEALMDEINATEDPKSIQEIQARIAAEQASLANEDTKLRMLQMVADAEDKLARQQQHELLYQEFTRTKLPQFEAITSW